MRYTRNRLFFATVAVLIFFSRRLLLAPLVCSRIKPAQRRHFQTRRMRTLCALLLCTCLALAMPAVVNVTLSIVTDGSEQTPDHYFRFTRASMFCFTVAAILILAAQIIQRRTMMKFLNGAQYLLQHMGVFDGAQLIDGKAAVLFSFKITLAVFGFSENFFYFFVHRDKIRPLNMLAGIMMVLLMLYRILAGVNIAAGLVLLTTCFTQVEKRLRRPCKPAGPLKESSILELTAIHHEMRKLVLLFERSQGFTVLVLIIDHLINMLSTLYSHFFFYILTQVSYTSTLIYAIIIAVDLYSLMIIAHEFSESLRRVNDAFSHRYIENIANKEMGPLAQSTHCWHPLCPQTTDICILGLFKLNHKLWTYLVSFSVNFVVLILQFALIKKPIII